MAETEPTISTYHKRLWGTVWREMRRPLREMLLVAVGAVVGALLQDKYHFIPLDSKWTAWLSNGGAWALFVIVAYIVYHLWRAPWKLDRERYLEIQRLTAMNRELIAGLPSVEQVGELRMVARAAADLRNEFQNHEAPLKHFPHPLDASLLQHIPPTAPGYTDIALLQRQYFLHRHQTCVATSGTSCDTAVREYANPADKTWEDIRKMLRDNETALNAQAAAILDPLKTRPTASTP